MERNSQGTLIDKRIWNSLERKALEFQCGCVHYDSRWRYLTCLTTKTTSLKPPTVLGWTSTVNHR